MTDPVLPGRKPDAIPSSGRLRRLVESKVGGAAEIRID